MKRLLLSLFAATILPAAAGEPLFNGRDLSGWTGADGKPVTAGWTVEPGGILHRAAKGGDLYTAKEYGDFSLSFDWKIAAGGNSGVKYRVVSFPGKGLIGPEYQLLDDARHPDGKIGPHRQTAAFYDLLPADPALKKLNPPGEWNTTKIVARGSKLEHWLNGVKVLEVDTAGDTFKAAFAKSKFKNAPGFALNPKGRIFLQDHGDAVWFRNLLIEEL